MRTVRKSATIALLSVLLVVTLALPTAASAGGPSAAAGYRPDGRVRYEKQVLWWGPGNPREVYEVPTPSWLGDDIYNSTGYNQTAKEGYGGGSVWPQWARWVFGVSIENDGINGDRFLVHATGIQLDQWTVRYFHGTTNITPEVAAGTFSTPTLAPGEKFRVKVQVTLDGYSPDVLRRLVTITSVHNPDRVDAVKVVLKPNPMGCGC